MANSTRLHKRANQLKGRPVCVTLHDGRSYVGWITGLEKDGLYLSSQPARKTNRRPLKAVTSGFLPLFGESFFGGAAGAGEAGAGAVGAAEASAGAGTAPFGGLGFLGMMQKALPVMQMGFNMIKTIMPLMNGIKGLMA